MRIIKVLIIDDDPYAVLFLERLLKNKLLVITESCETISKALEKLKRYDFDLIFLDLNLGEELGSDLLEIVSCLPPVIIFSSSDSFAIGSYDYLNVKDYLLKPINEVRLLKAVNRALDLSFNDKTIEHKDYIFVKVGRKVHRFEYDKIDYLEAFGIYTKIYENKQMTLVNESISNLEAVLPQNSFLRVHKSFIINITKLTSYDTRNFNIGDLSIPIGGETYRRNLEGIIRLLKGGH